MGMANKAPKSQRKSRMSSKGAGLSDVICHALTTMATAVYRNPMTAAMLTYNEGSCLRGRHKINFSVTRNMLDILSVTFRPRRMKKNRDTQDRGLF